MAGFVLLHEKLQEASEHVQRVEGEGRQLDEQLRAAEAEAVERKREIQRLEQLLQELEAEYSRRVQAAEEMQLQARETKHRWKTLLHTVTETLARTDSAIENAMTLSLADEDCNRKASDLTTRAAHHRRKTEGLQEQIRHKQRELAEARREVQSMAEPAEERRARADELAALRAKLDEEVENLNSLELCCYTLELENERLEQRQRMFRQQLQQQQQLQQYNPMTGQIGGSQQHYPPASEASSFSSSCSSANPTAQRSPKRRRGFQSSLKILLDDLVIPDFKDHW